MNKLLLAAIVILGGLELSRLTTIITPGAERVAAQNAAAVSTREFWAEKSPDRVARRGSAQSCYAHIYHGWQFACNVATGEEACRNYHRF